MSSIQNTKTISRLNIKNFAQSECWFEDWHNKLEHQITFFVGTHCLVTSMKIFSPLKPKHKTTPVKTNTGREEGMWPIQF